MTTPPHTSGPPSRPWFARRKVRVVAYRINRHPRPQGNLFGSQPKDFLAHLDAALRFGYRVVISNTGDRQWQLGNRTINGARGYLAGMIGSESRTAPERTHFDETTADWILDVGTPQATVSPFAITTANQRLLVAKHSIFLESSVATAFTRILNDGEQARDNGRTTDWDVQPILDETEFEDWLGEITVLDEVTFVARLPNPDAEDSYRGTHTHMKQMKAGELRHHLRAAIETVGLSTSFANDETASEMLAMAKRGYAAVSAKARDDTGIVVVYRQRQSTRHRVVRFSSATHNDARDELADHAVEWAKEEDG